MKEEKENKRWPRNNIWLREEKKTKQKNSGKNTDKRVFLVFDW